MTEPLKTDPFSPESLDIQVGGKTLTLAPVPFKQFRAAMKVLSATWERVQTAAKANDMAVVQDVPGLVLDQFGDLAPLLFPGQGLTKEWVEDNFSLPLARYVIENAARINGVADFLAPILRSGVTRKEAIPPVENLPSPSSSTPSA